MTQSYVIEMIEKSDISLRARSKIHHPAGYSIQRHISDFDVLYTISGKHYFNIDGKEYISNPGDVHVLAPNSILSVHCNEASDQYYCHFTLKAQNKYDLTGNFVEHRLPENCRGLAGLYKEQFEHSDKVEVPLVSSVSLIFKLFLVEMLKADVRNQVSFVAPDSSTKPDELFEVLYYIHGHLSENLTVEKLAETAGFNPSYFSRYFKRYMGVSPIRYINEHKMNFAKHFISTTDKPLKEIAAMLGFPDQFAFSKKFKDNFGVSPSEFRKINI